MAELESGNKFCKHCGQQIRQHAVICPLCGGQVEELRYQQQSQPQVVVNNVNTNTNTVNAGPNGREKNKWIAFLLCFFLGGIGAHKFYEGRIGQGILYLFTIGIFGFGWLIDTIILLCKPNPYYV